MCLRVGVFAVTYFIYNILKH